MPLCTSWRKAAFSQERKEVLTNTFLGHFERLFIFTHYSLCNESRARVKQVDHMLLMETRKQFASSLANETSHISRDLDSRFACVEPIASNK